MLLYSAVINILSTLLDGAARLAPKKAPRKFFRFAKGQQGVIKRLQRDYRPAPAGTPTVWLHAASLGEYSIARPIIAEMRSRGYHIVMTFFSPTGYEALRDNHPDIDYLGYLPFDTRANARAFLDTVRPDKALFMVSEYWFNYLDLLKERGIDTYLVSSKITPKSIFFKPYGGLYRRCLDTYKHIYVVDDESRTNLQQVGAKAVSVAGNPLFDNAIQKAQTPWRDAVIERFCGDDDVFIAGSIHDENDLELVATLANRHPDVKFLMVPHEIHDDTVGKIAEAVQGKTRAYTACTADTNLSDTQVLVIDFVGALAYIYRYGKWAYIGGGFTRYLHSLIEATVYGLPVSFGPMTMRKVTPMQISDLGIGRSVSTPDELDAWFGELRHNPALMVQIAERAKKYVRSNRGATHALVDDIMSNPTTPSDETH